MEHIRAHAGIDIGGTLIGMNLRDVAVPVRLSIGRIGDANIICARTRPKYIEKPGAVALRQRRGFDVSDFKTQASVRAPADRLPLRHTTSRRCA